MKNIIAPHVHQKLPSLNITFVVLLLLIGLTSARFAKPSFSGDWNLSKEKSKMAEGRARFIYNQLKVTQSGNDLVIVRNGQSPNGQEFIIEEKINLDGKESTNNFFDGMVIKKSIAKWSADEKSLTINSDIIFNRDGNEVRMKSTEVWDITTGPAALTINYVSSSPNGELQDTYVYDKK